MKNLFFVFFFLIVPLHALARGSYWPYPFSQPDQAGTYTYLLSECYEYGAFNRNDVFRVPYGSADYLFYFDLPWIQKQETLVVQIDTFGQVSSERVLSQSFSGYEAFQSATWEGGERRLKQRVDHYLVQRRLSVCQESTYERLAP